MNLELFADLQPNLLQIFSGVVILAWVIMSLVLVYHWRRYGLHKKTIIVVMVIYFFVSLTLLTVIARAALAIV